MHPVSSLEDLVQYANEEEESISGATEKEQEKPLKNREDSRF
jgi:hypothetical protein